MINLVSRYGPQLLILMIAGSSRLVGQVQQSTDSLSFDPLTGKQMTTKPKQSDLRFDPNTGMPLMEEAEPDTFPTEPETGQQAQDPAVHTPQTKTSLEMEARLPDHYSERAYEQRFRLQLAGGVLGSHHLQEPGLNISVSCQFPRTISIGGLPRLTTALTAGILHGVSESSTGLCTEAFNLGYGLFEGHLNWGTPNMKAALFLGGGVTRYDSKWGGSGCGGKAYGAGVVLSPGALIGSRHLALELRALPLPVRGKSFGRIAWVASIAYSLSGLR